jgi:chemotaxis protein MotB
MAAQQECEICEEPDDMMTTYADAITLLMAFFVMLLTFAEYDVPAYQEAAAAIAENIGAGEKDSLSDTETLKIDMEDVVYEMQADQVVEVSLDKKGVVIDLAGGAFFKPGTAQLNEIAIPVLGKITKMIQQEKFKLYNIEVEGHSDPSPISTEMFPSNWELSSARASTVVRFFGESGLNFLKMKAVGFAETQPKVPNFDQKGEPIPENQRTNRRISIRVYPMSMKERAKFGVKIDLKKMLKGVNTKQDQENSVDVKPADLESGIEIQQR